MEVGILKGKRTGWNAERRVDEFGCDCFGGLGGELGRRGQVEGYAASYMRRIG